MIFQIVKIAILGTQQCAQPTADHQRRVSHPRGKTLSTTLSRALRHSLALVAGTALLVACADEAALAQSRQAAFAEVPAEGAHRAIATLRRATAHYHDLDNALDDGFVLLHECENRPGEGPVGTVYVHLDRLMDGLIDPELPDALIYEPGRRHNPPKLVGVELAIPYDLWTEPQPPQFLGVPFQPEDEFGVFALHAWVWRKNPHGVFAETNPRVSCEGQ
jgi:hypothetical protein